MAGLQAWLKAARLRTLPLALSGIMLGSALAYQWNKVSFNRSVFVMSLLTAILLQVLSNFANDYGDFKKGTDNINRIGNKRSLQSGDISIKQMLNAIFITAVLALSSGLLMLFMAFGKQSGELYNILFFIVLGVISIIAAIKYTVGKKSYGYRAIGDLAVFIFFGPVAVCGSFYLHNLRIENYIYFGALTVGLLSVGVLNINNIRDIENDLNSNKLTIANLLGEKKAKIYQIILIGLSISFIYVLSLLLFNNVWKFIFLFPVVLIIHNAVLVYITPIGTKFNLFLKQLALSTFALIVFFIIALFI